MSFARGNRAWGQCGRCGQRVLLRDLIEDGYVPGLMVEPRCYDAPHPQEQLPPSEDDPVSVEDPSPDSDDPGEVVSFPNFDVVTGAVNDSLQIGLFLGYPTVEYDEDFDYYWVDNEGNNIVDSNGNRLVFS